MANIHYEKKEIAKARYYLTLAMEGFTEDFNPGLKMLIYDTFLEIYATEGTKLLGVILDVFEKSTVINEFQNHLSSCVEKLLLQLKENVDTGSVKRLMVKQVKYCRLEGDKRPLGELKALVVDMIHYLQDKGLLDIEKSW